MGGKLSSEVATKDDSLDDDNRTNEHSIAISEGCQKAKKPEHEFLTEEQETALKESWKLIKTKNLLLVGVNLLLKLFEIEPKTMDTFKVFQGLSHDEVLKAPLFMSHAIRFMKAVEVTIDNIDALDVIMIPNLKRLGSTHAKIESFKVSYLQVVEQAFEEVWTKMFNGEKISVPGIPDEAPLCDGKNEALIKWEGPVKEAWVLTVTLITSKFAEGYEEGLQQRKLKEGQLLEKKASQLQLHEEIHQDQQQQAQ